MLEGTEKGGVRNSIQNCLTVFQYDLVLSGATAKNLLTERKDLIKRIHKWRSPGRAVTDTDMKYIRLYLEKNYSLTSEKKIEDAAELAAEENAYHPVREYLDSLVWDGTERIRYCLRRFLGADTDEYTYQSLRLFLLGAVCRVFSPGCKFEVMFCMVGRGAGRQWRPLQQCCKSTDRGGSREPGNPRSSDSLRSGMNGSPMTCGSWTMTTCTGNYKVTGSLKCQR